MTSQSSPIFMIFTLDFKYFRQSKSTFNMGTPVCFSYKLPLFDFQRPLLTSKLIGNTPIMIAVEKNVDAVLLLSGDPRPTLPRNLREITRLTIKMRPETRKLVQFLFRLLKLLPPSIYEAFEPMRIDICR